MGYTKQGIYVIIYCMGDETKSDAKRLHSDEYQLLCILQTTKSKVFPVCRILFKCWVDAWFICSF